MRVVGAVGLCLGAALFLIAGKGPFEGPVGLLVGSLGGCVLSAVGGIFFGKSFLE